MAIAFLFILLPIVVAVAAVMVWGACKQLMLVGRRIYYLLV